MKPERGGAARLTSRKRTTLVVAGILLLLAGLVFLLPILAVTSRGGINFGVVAISAEVYDQPSRKAPFILQRRLEGPRELADMLDSAAPPELPWSAGREVRLSLFGWTYRASIIYPGAYRRESERMLKERGIWYRYQR